MDWCIVREFLKTCRSLPMTSMICGKYLRSIVWFLRNACTYTKGMSLYAASKGAVNSMVKVIAKELVRREIRVNAIMPGFVNTKLLTPFRESVENFDEMIQKEQPWGLIEPEQVADLAEFLLSEQSRMITGALIPITGGKVV